MKSRLPTLAEVAEAAGVSRMTASRALNNQPGVSRPVREEILQIASKLGYSINRTAQKLSGGKSRIIGLVAIRMQNPFTAEVITGAVRTARTAGYEMLVYSLVEGVEPQPSVTHLLEHIADGVIAVLPYSGRYLRSLADASVPVITVEDGVEPLEFPSIGCDNYRGARAAVEHLAELGHRRIGFITGHEALSSARERRRGYLDVLTERRLPREESLIAEGDYTQRGGFDAARKLLALPRRPTAIFAANDDAAMGVLSAAQKMQLRIPEDLSIVGFDDSPQSAQVHPGITTVRQPMQEMGGSAVNMLLAMMAGIDPTSPVTTFPTELVVRGSTASPSGPPGKGSKRSRAARTER
jgi:LacI family transcriptional regulator